MADFYDVTDPNYYDMISYPYTSQRLRVDFLDHFENALYRVEQDIDASDAGRIVNNNTQGTRRSFSFTLVNIDNIYNILDEETFWFNRKFRVYLGITNGTDSYWFTKGVYVTENADMDSLTKSVALNGVDKYAQLDGSLNVLQADEIDTVFEVGSKISNVIRDILMLDMGNGQVLDPIEPIIDPVIGEQRLYKEFTMSAGSYYGDFLTEVMTSFGCDIFYDTLGRLTVRRVFNDDRPYWFAFKSPSYNFTDEVWGFQSPRITFDMKGINKITVSTENVNYPNVSETAINNNPRSPLCAGKIGRRTFTENGGIIYISLGDEEIDTPEMKCREYAEYRLMQETCLALEASFQCPPLYHLCEGDVITITDRALGLEREAFLINSITISAGTDSMSVSAVNLKYLPTDIYIDSIYTKQPQAQFGETTLSFDLNGGTGTTPSSITSGNNNAFLVPTGLNNDNTLSFDHGVFADTNEFVNWVDQYGITYTPGTYHYKPLRDVTLYAYYVDTYENSMTVSLISSSSTKSFTSWLPDNYDDYNVEGIARQTTNPTVTKKYYFKGRNEENETISLSNDASNGTIKYFTDANYAFDYDSPAKFIAALGATSLGAIIFPRSMTKLDFTDYTLATGVTGTVSFPPYLHELEFADYFLSSPFTSPATINLAESNSLTITGEQGASMLDASHLHVLTAVNGVTVRGKGANGITFVANAPARSVTFVDLLEVSNVKAFDYAGDYDSSTPYTAGQGWDKIYYDTLHPATHTFKDLYIRNSGRLYCGGTYYDDSTHNYLIRGSSNLKLTVANTLSISSSSDKPSTNDGLKVLCDAAIGELTLNNVSVEFPCRTFTNLKLTDSSNIQLSGNLWLRQPGFYCFNNIENLTFFKVSGNANFTGLSGDNRILYDNPNLATVEFHGEVNINLNRNSGTFKLLCNNPSLTYVVFKTTSVRLFNSGNTGSYELFKNNNANFMVVLKRGTSNQKLLDYLNNNNINYGWAD